MPDRNRNEPAMPRANQRQAGIARTLVSMSLQEAQIPAEMVDDHRQDRDAARHVDGVPSAARERQGRASGELSTMLIRRQDGWRDPESARLY